MAKMFRLHPHLVAIYAIYAIWSFCLLFWCCEAKLKLNTIVKHFSLELYSHWCAVDPTWFVIKITKANKWDDCVPSEHMHTKIYKKEVQEKKESSKGWKHDDWVSWWFHYCGRFSWYSSVFVAFAVRPFKNVCVWLCTKCTKCACPDIFYGSFYFYSFFHSFLLALFIICALAWPETRTIRRIYIFICLVFEILEMDLCVNAWHE